ncbi:unnamed protein product [Brassica oleracea]
MASLQLWKKIAAPLTSNGRKWKMACTTVAAPFSSGAESSGPIKVEKESSGPKKPEKVKVEKRKVFQKLKSLRVETIDLIIREEEKKGVFVDQEDLFRWAKLLKNHKPENSLEIFRWMDKKKMVFSPSQLELFVDLLGELKGAEAALAYFDKVEPNFDEMDAEAKNRPAYLKLLYWFRVKEESQTSGARTHVLKFPKCDDNWNVLK